MYCPKTKKEHTFCVIQCRVLRFVLPLVQNGLLNLRQLYGTAITKLVTLNGHIRLDIFCKLRARARVNL